MARVRIETHATAPVATEQSKERGGLGRFFRRSPKKQAVKKDEKRDRTPSPQASTEEENHGRESPEMQPEPKLVSPKVACRKDTKKNKVPSPPPPASKAAFSGPPRYNWIDIVSFSFSFISCIHLDAAVVDFNLTFNDLIWWIGIGNFGRRQGTGGLSTQQGDE